MDESADYEPVIHAQIFARGRNLTEPFPFSTRWKGFEKVIFCLKTPFLDQKPRKVNVIDDKV